MMNEPGPGAIASRFSEGPVETEADAIVRELAKDEPWCADPGYIVCFYCEQEEGALHRDTCLWLRARKLAGMG